MPYRILLVCCASLLVASCVHVSYIHEHVYAGALPAAQETSARDTQISASLDSSLLVQTAKTFYTERHGGLVIRTPSKTEFVHLQSELSGVLDTILLIEQAESSELSSVFDTPIPSKPAVSLVLYDVTDPTTADPYAASTLDRTNAALTITVNAAFLRSLLRAAIAESLHHPSAAFPEIEGSVHSGQRATPIALLDSPNCPDDACLDQFMRFVNALDRKRLTPTEATYASVIFQAIYARYYGTLFFTVAHELGHYVFGHHLHPCDAPVCSIFKHDELQADAFAAYLLSLNVATKAGMQITLFNDILRTTDMIGFPVFFEKAYPRLGWENATPQTLCACSYPTESEREENATEWAQKAIDSAPQLLEEEDRIAIATMVQKAAERASSENHDSAPQNQNTGAISNLSPLFPIPVGNRVGYMDRTGKIVISPSFDDALDFHDGLALVYLPARGHNHTDVDRGFVDRAGRVMFRVNFRQNAQYNSTDMIPTAVDDFVDDRALVEVMSQSGQALSGFIGTDGKLVIDAQFADANSFSQGLARVAIWGRNSGLSFEGFIRPDGTYAIGPEFRHARDFSGGLAAVQDLDSKKWGYINKAGVFVIPPQFDNAWDFSQGLALAELSGVRRFITLKGAFVGKSVKAAWEFSEGLAAVNYDGTLEDRGELARSQWIKSGKWGYIDKSGKEAIPVAYDFAKPFSEGVAAVNVGGTADAAVVDGGKWGFIGADGRYVIPLQFSDANSFHDGLAQVQKNGVTMYIDHSGHIVSPHQ